MNDEQIQQFKAMQRERWAHFIPFEVFTTPPASHLVSFADVKAGHKVLDVGCGTGVVAITAARRGAQVCALDLTPALLARAAENAAIAQTSVEFTEGDVEKLPYPDAMFDIVLSQFGHMFAPRPEIAIAEMMRVLKPQGRIAFSTWPPELFVCRMFSLVDKYIPVKIEFARPQLWGEPTIIIERLGKRVKDILFDRQVTSLPSLSPQQTRQQFESASGSIMSLIEMLSNENPNLISQFRREFEELIASFVKENVLQEHFLMTRATKI